MNEETFEVEAMEGTEWSTWYKRIIGRYTVPTAQEERELLIRAHQGDMGARNELVVRNLRLVFKFAVRHFSRSRLTVSFADIIQAGNLGLIDAVDDFDPTRFATRFSTYAEHHIKKHFFRLMQQDQTVRIPTDTHSRVRKYLAAKEALCATLGREPTVGEVASRLAMDIKKVQLLETFSWQSSSLSDGEEVDMQLQSHELSPLDALLKKEAEKTLGYVFSRIDERTLQFLKEYVDSKGDRVVAAEVRQRYRLKSAASASDKAAHIRRRILVHFRNKKASEEHLFM